MKNFGNDYVIHKDYAILKVRRKDFVLDVLIDVEDIDKIKKYTWNALLDKTLQTPSYYIYNRYNSKSKGKEIGRAHV